MIDAQDQIKRGVLWLGSATAVARVIDIGATITVLGLLTREQMGLAALALSVAAVVESISGFGIGHALIQAEDVSDRERSSLFWLTSLGGVVLGLVMLGLAPVLVDW